MEWAWDLEDHEVNWPRVQQELSGMGLIDGNGRTDPDRVNHWGSVQHLVSEGRPKGESKEDRDASIARVVRVAAQLVERFDHLQYFDEGLGNTPMLTYELAFEVAMVWEFG